MSWLPAAAVHAWVLAGPRVSRCLRRAAPVKQPYAVAVTASARLPHYADVAGRVRRPAARVGRRSVLACRAARLVRASWTSWCWALAPRPRVNARSQGRAGISRKSAGRRGQERWPRRAPWLSGRLSLGARPPGLRRLPHLPAVTLCRARGSAARDVSVDDAIVAGVDDEAMMGAPVAGTRRAAIGWSGSHWLMQDPKRCCHGPEECSTC